MVSIRMLAIPRAVALSLDLAVSIALLYFGISTLRFNVFVYLAPALSVIVDVAELPALIRYERSRKAYVAAVLETRTELFPHKVHSSTQSIAVYPEHEGQNHSVPDFWSKWRKSCFVTDCLIVIFQIAGLVFTISRLTVVFNEEVAGDYEIQIQELFRRMALALVTVIALTGAALYVRPGLLDLDAESKLTSISRLSRFSVVFVYFAFGARLKRQIQDLEAKGVGMADEDRDEIGLQDLSPTHDG